MDRNDKVSFAIRRATAYWSRRLRITEYDVKCLAAFSSFGELKGSKRMVAGIRALQGARCGYVSPQWLAYWTRGLEPFSRAAQDYPNAPAF